MHFDPVPFDYVQGAVQWLKIVFAVVLVILAILIPASLGAMGARGPGAVFRQLLEGLRDISELSLRRIWALATLTIREAVRRKALLVFVVFGVLFMFGSWFLSGSGEKADIQIERHVVFVFTAISWLVLPVVLMLSCWGIPEDIKARSMHTVVTKPARRVEVVLGRMIGFSVIATLIVGLMGIVGYLWIERQISEDARERLVCKVPVYGRLSFINREGDAASAGINVGDIWAFRSYIEGSTKATAVWEFENITPSNLVRPTDPGAITETDSSPGAVVLKVRPGSPADVGGIRAKDTVVSIGEQPVASAADFNRVIASLPVGRTYEVMIVRDGKKSKVDLPWYESLVLQSSFEAFRSHKGVINSGLLCELTLVGPDKKSRVPLPPFEVAEYRGDGNQTLVPSTIDFYDSESKKRTQVGLFDKLVSDGHLRVEARCLNQEQYLGMARPDLFIRTADRAFAVGYFKALLGVWLQAIMVVMIGVAVSCFLKGPIATLLTFCVLVVGQGFHELIVKIVNDQQLGGGPTESIYRIVTQLNQTVSMDLSKPVTGTIHGVDYATKKALWLVEQTFPNFSYFGMSPYVAKGFDVDFRAAILPSIAVTLAYLIPCVLLGYYALKLRELETK